MMKPYSDYKKTNLNWLPEIPKHWEKSTVRGITKTISERGQPDLQLLSVYRDFGVIRRTKDDKNHNTIPEDLSNYKVVRKNNLVLNKMKTWQGSLGVSEFEGIVSPAYIVCGLLGNNNPQFIHRLLRSKLYIFVWKRISYGVRVDQWDMRYMDFKQTHIFLPPREEQDAIVEFLEAKEAKIKKFIKNKKRIIELLKEQKNAVINRAVTRGLDKNVSLKSSGINWLGNIPEHWEVKRLKTVVKNITEQKSSKKQNEIYIALENIESWTGNLLENKEDANFESIVKCFQPRDVLFNKLRPYLAKVLLAEQEGVCVSELLVFRVQEKVFLPEFLAKFLLNKLFIDVVDSSTFGAKMPRASWSFIKNLKIVMPPISEQKEIVEHIERRNAEIDTAIEQAEKEIVLMREYRVSLIDAAVTGKIDCRKAKTAKILQFKAKAANQTQKFNPFWRTVVGTEIVAQNYQDKTFGHVKFMKQLYLVEHHAELEGFGSNYFRHEMGPHDKSLLISIEKQMRNAKYFKTVGSSEKYIYQPLDKFGEHRKYFEEHWGNKKTEIQTVIDLLKPYNKEICEMIATTYAVWNDFLIEDRDFTDDDIVNEVLTNWHESKQKIEAERWLNALKWMREKNFVPKGFGEMTKKAKKK